MVKLSIGNGWEAEVNPPERGDFASNFGGDVAFTLASMLFVVVRKFGSVLGDFLGSGMVSFLEHVEPEMITYVSPLIDFALGIPNLPPELRDALENIRSPKDPVGAIVLTAIAGVLVGGAMGPLVATAMKGPSQEIEKALRQTQPDPVTSYNLWHRGAFGEERAKEAMRQAGYPDDVINGIDSVLRPRADVGALLEGVRRGDYSADDLKGEMSKRGYTGQDIDIVTKQADALLDVGSILRAYHRDDLNSDQAHDKLNVLGFPDVLADLILKNSEVIPGVSDLVTMAVREAWDDGLAWTWGYDDDYSTEFGNWAEKQGMSDDWARKYWRAHWQLPSVSLGYQMFHRGIIKEHELEGLLRTADYPSGWRGKMIDAAYSPITRVDVRRFYRLGLLDYDGLVARYQMLGYNPTDATLMADFTVKYESTDPEDEYGKVRDLTRSVIEKAYRLGKITREETVAKLSELGYITESIELTLSLVELQMELDNVPDYLEDYRDDLSKLIIKSYTNRMISESRATDYLIDLGLDPVEIPLRLQISDFAYTEAMKDRSLDLIGESYIKRIITRTRALELVGAMDLTGGQQGQIFQEWDIGRTLRTRTLSEAQYRKAHKGELLTTDEYAEAMRGLGYNERDVGILVAMATGSETVPESEPEE